MWMPTLPFRPRRSASASDQSTLAVPGAIRSSRWVPFRSGGAASACAGVRLISAHAAQGAAADGTGCADRGPAASSASTTIPPYRATSAADDTDDAEGMPSRATAVARAARGRAGV